MMKTLMSTKPNEAMNFEDFEEGEMVLGYMELFWYLHYDSLDLPSLSYSSCLGIPMSTHT